MGWVVGGIAAGVLLALVLLYNRLVRARNRVEEAWAQVDVQLRRRHDLIPNLIETVRAYADHERTVLTQVAQARSEAIAPHPPAEQADVEARLDGALRSLFAVSENYPELRASENFLELARELSSTEDRIAYSRQYYNASVRHYDTARQTFPGTLVAGPFGFEDREYFEVTDPSARSVPGVSLAEERPSDA